MPVIQSDESPRNIVFLGAIFLKGLAKTGTAQCSVISKRMAAIKERNKNTRRADRQMNM